MLIEPEFSAVSIVLVGNLNPKIFTPDWFARHDLLTAREADAAEVEIIHSQVAKFRAGWLTIFVDTNRFSADTSGQTIQLRDLVVRTFQEKLSHTSIGKMGINRQMHFTVGSIEKRDQIGHKLAPPEAWGEWAPDIRAIEGRLHGGMQSLTMQQSVCDGRFAGHIQATVQPSTKIKNNTGIYVQINDHYEVSDPDKAPGCEEIIDHLAADFDKSIKRSDWIIEKVMALRDD